MLRYSSIHLFWLTALCASCSAAGDTGGAQEPHERPEWPECGTGRVRLDDRPECWRRRVQLHDRRGRASPISLGRGLP